MTVANRDIYHAAKQADEFMGEGDIEGRAVWLRVKSAAEELLRVEARGAVH